MKKLAYLLLSAGLYLTACSSDNDGVPSSGNNKPNPAQVFTAGIPETMASYRIETNAHGWVEQIKDESNRTVATFSYPVLSRAADSYESS